MMNTNKRYWNRILTIRISIFLIIIISLLIIGNCSKPGVYRIGVLSGLENFAETTDGFKERMTELGYVEDKNITYDVENSNFDIAAYDRILKKFVLEKVDMIFVYPTEAAMQAKAVTRGTGVPVVFTNAFTEDSGLVNTVQEPGGNITGVRWPGPEIVTKSFTIMLELFPNVKQLWVPYQRGYPIVKSQLEIMRKAALSANITLVEIPASHPGELESELKKQKGPFDGVVIQMIAEPLVVNPAGLSIVTTFASQNKIPIAEGSLLPGDYQPLYQFVPWSAPQGRQAAYLADKIFKGTPAGKIPVVTAEYSLTINYKQAERLKLQIPDDILGQAEKIDR
ncbi:MAG: ABC transporter substrate-binding protein [Spirochaetales bacterium]|nr:ABC transporter substrate-binding protein [Spirochaetales bacterium]